MNENSNNLHVIYQKRLWYVQLQVCWFMLNVHLHKCHYLWTLIHPKILQCRKNISICKIHGWQKQNGKNVMKMGWKMIEGSYNMGVTTIIVDWKTLYKYKIYNVIQVLSFIYVWNIKWFLGYPLCIFYVCFLFSSSFIHIFLLFSTSKINDKNKWNKKISKAL